MIFLFQSFMVGPAAGHGPLNIRAESVRLSLTHNSVLMGQKGFGPENLSALLIKSKPYEMTIRLMDVKAVSWATGPGGKTTGKIFWPQSLEHVPHYPGLIKWVCSFE